MWATTSSIHARAISWPARIQSFSLSGYDAFRGSQADDASSSTPGTPDVNLTSLVPLTTPAASCNVPNVTPGTPISLTITGDPALNSMHYYLVGHNPTIAGGQAGLGRRGDGTMRPLAPLCP